MLSLLKQAILESVTHAVVALGMLMINPEYDTFFDEISVEKVKPHPADNRHFISWAEFLVEQSSAHFLPDFYQTRARETVIRGIERVKHTLNPHQPKLVASVPGYLALYLLQMNQPRASFRLCDSRACRK